MRGASQWDEIVSAAWLGRGPTVAELRRKRIKKLKERIAVVEQKLKHEMARLNQLKEDVLALEQKGR